MNRAGMQKQMQGGMKKKSATKIPNVDASVKKALNQQNKKKQLMASFTGESPTLKRIKSNLKNKKRTTV